MRGPAGERVGAALEPDSILRAGRLKLRHHFRRKPGHLRAVHPRTAVPSTSHSQETGTVAEPPPSKGSPSHWHSPFTQGDTGATAKDPTEQCLVKNLEVSSKSHTPAVLRCFLHPLWQELRGYRALVVEEAFECADLQHGHQQQHGHVGS